MSNLITFFTSFDKLMKERLVIAFYWLALISILVLAFFDFFGVFKSGLLAIPFLIKLILKTLLAIVALRLICEAAIALFRINDNLSPDGGKSETADIDPLLEARKAAEDAAKRAREATSNLASKTKAAASSTGESIKSKASDLKDSAVDTANTAKKEATKAKDKVASTAKKTKPTAKKSTKGTTTTSKATSKTTTSKSKSAPKAKASSKTKTTSKTKPASKIKISSKVKPDPKIHATDKDGNVIFNKDGSPRKRRGVKKA